MDLVHNLTSWPRDLNDSTENDPLPDTINMQYRLRNAVLGALGVVLNVLVLPVICQNDDLPIYLKATFCYMILGDLVAMATTLVGCSVRAYVTEDQFALILPKVTCAIYLAGNINCMVMLAIAVERLLTLHRPELFRRLGKRKVKVVVVTPLVLVGSGIMVTLPLLVTSSRRAESSEKLFTPLSSLSEIGLATEAGICILSSLAVCFLYASLAFTLMRRASPRPLPPAGMTSSTTQVTEMATSSARCSGTQPGLANGGSASETTSGTSSSECGPTAHIHITLRQMRRFRRATVHSAVLAVWFFLAYAPFGFYYLWLLLSGTDRMAESRTVRITTLSSFPLANSLVDPVLLLWRLFPFSAVGGRLQAGAVQAMHHLRQVYQGLGQRCAGACSCCVGTLQHRRRWWWWRRRRRNRVENLPADPPPSILRGRGRVRTVVVKGASCSPGAIQVQEAPVRKKVRLKSAAPDTPASACSICRIEERSQDTVT